MQNEGFDRAEALAIVQHFAGKPVNNDVLMEFCNLHGFKAIGTDTYEDYKFAYEHDQRINLILPDILKVLSKIQNPPELASEQERTKVIDANEALEEEMAYLCEKHGILYQEVDILLGGLGSVIKRCVDGANTRVNNAASLSLLKMAEERFGRPISVRTLGEYSRGGKEFKTVLEARTEIAPAPRYS